MSVAEVVQALEPFSEVFVLMIACEIAVVLVTAVVGWFRKASSDVW